MLASSRLANTVRVAMPYAQWLGYLIQLGYVGYKSYQIYQDYRAQLEADARNGCNRTLDETIELVIKPRRKRDVNTTPPPGTNSTENQENRQNINELDESTARHHAKTAIDAGTSSASTSNEENKCAEDEVTIVYDSCHDSRKKSSYEEEPIDEQPSTSNRAVVPKQGACDSASNASTSMESTNSNKGIISDIYTECFICARSLEDPRKPVATLPFCMHPFHQTCLDSVLKWHPRCPVCDFHIFSPI
jgi:hypothetical protein